MEATTIISIIALIISFISILISNFNFNIDRQIQVEELKGKIITNLTYRGLDIVDHIENINNIEENYNIIKDLKTIAEKINYLRGKVEKFYKPSNLLGSRIIPKLYSIKNQLNDMEPVFNRLKQSVDEGNMEYVRNNVDGLIKRLG